VAVLLTPSASRAAHSWATGNRVLPSGLARFRRDSKSTYARHPHLPPSGHVEAEPAPVRLRLALIGQGGEIIARVQDPAGEMVSCAECDSADELGGGLAVSPPLVCRFAETWQPRAALSSTSQSFCHRWSRFRRRGNGHSVGVNGLLAAERLAGRQLPVHRAAQVLADPRPSSMSP
jgi:hypothetical protein